MNVYVMYAPDRGLSKIGVARDVAARHKTHRQFMRRLSDVVVFAFWPRPKDAFAVEAIALWLTEGWHRTKEWRGMPPETACRAVLRAMRIIDSGHGKTMKRLIAERRRARRIEK